MNNISEILLNIIFRKHVSVSHGLYKCSSIDNFLPSIPFSDWLILCCGNLILYQKRDKKDKSTNFIMKKNKKNTKKVYEKVNFYSELAPLTCDVACSEC